MDAQELVRLAMQQPELASTRKLAAKLGVSNVTVSKWLNGTDCPTFENAEELALMVGLPPVATAAAVRMGSKDGARHKALLRKMTTLAAGIVLAASLMPLPARAYAPETSRVIGAPCILCKVSEIRFAVVRVFGTLLAALRSVFARRQAFAV